MLQRVIHSGLPEFIRDAQASGSVVVYDIDDWYDGIPAYNPASTHISAEDVATMHQAMSLVDVVTCSTPELAEGYARLNRTAVLANYLDPDIWGDVSVFAGERSAIHVGWLGKTDYRSADLDLLRPWLTAFLADHPEVRFVAHRSTLELLGVPGLAPPLTEHGQEFRPYDHLPALLTWLDVGLVPLAQNRFNQCKSACKGMESNAAGAAVVASPSREYRSYVTPGLNGFLVRKNDWRGAIERTLDNLDELKVGARKVAEQHFVDDAIHRWTEAWGF